MALFSYGLYGTSCTGPALSDSDVQPEVVLAEVVLAEAVLA